MDEAILKVNHIYKTFGIVKALTDVSFSVYPGEIRGLVGENGSGKSTVSSIIAGIEKADSGDMEFLGKPYTPKSMIDALKQGVSMIVQEKGTISGTTVAHNIFPNRENEFSKFGFVNRKKMNRAAQECLDQIGLNHIKAEMPIRALSFEDRKLVEVARSVMEKPRLMIVDETTTALSQNGRDSLYALMRKMADEGSAILFISHDLDELMDKCSVITVLRDGVIIDNLSKEQMNEKTIKNLMVGRELSDKYYREDYGESTAGEVALKAEHISGPMSVADVSFELHKGEILGIAGLSNSGIHELGYLLYGAMRPITGKVTLVDGASPKNISESIDHRIGYISKNRDEEALILGDTIKRNLTLSALKQLKKAGIITPKAEKQFSEKQIRELEIKCYSPNQDVSTLSGGNKQKVSFGKWIGNNSEIIIMDCPTRGVDVAVKATMYQLMDDLRRQGKAILLIAEEMAEVLGMSDRILVIKKGRIEAEFQRSPELTEHDIIEHMI